MPALGFGGSSTVGSGGGGSNPTPPDPLWITPAQAWADNIQQTVGWDALNMSNKGFTYFNPDLAAMSVQKQFSISISPLSIDLHDNALPTANVDAILAAIRTLAETGATIPDGILLLAGAEMGTVTPATPAAPQVNGRFTLNFAAVDIEDILTHATVPQEVTYSGGQGSFLWGGNTYTITYDAGLAFASSTFSSPDITVGTQDFPTNAEIVEYVYNIYKFTEGEIPAFPESVTHVGDAMVMSASSNAFTELTGDFIQTQAYTAGEKQYAGTMTSSQSVPIAIYFDPDLDVSDSLYNVPPGGDGSISIGAQNILNDPADYLNELQDIINVAEGAWDPRIHASFVGALMTLTFTDINDYPIEIGDWTDGDVGVVGAVVAAGAAAQMEVWNADLLALQALGWTGSFHDPVDGPETPF